MERSGFTMSFKNTEPLSRALTLRPVLALRFWLAGRPPHGHDARHPTPSLADSMTPDAPPSPTDAAPWRHILSDTPDALIFADTQGVIRAWNAGAEAVFGFSAADAIGQSLDVIIPERLRAAHWVGFHRAMARGTTSHGAEVRTTRGVHKDGRKLYVDMSFGVVRDDAAKVLGSVAMARDVTERHLAQGAGRTTPTGA